MSTIHNYVPFLIAEHEAITLYGVWRRGLPLAYTVNDARDPTNEIITSFDVYNEAVLYCASLEGETV